MIQSENPRFEGAEGHAEERYNSRSGDRMSSSMGNIGGFSFSSVS